MVANKHPAALLIVDDRADVRTALRRYFGLFFECVLTAASPAEAEAHLRERQPPVVLCDFWLGSEYPLTTELIPGWRKRHPCIRALALMTGTKSSAVEGAEGVDAVFRKPLDLNAVREFLLAAVRR